MSAVDRKDKIIGDLQDLLKLTELQVRPIYQQSEELFHRLLTMTDLNVILTMNEEIVTSLVCLLMNVIGSGNFNPLYGKTLMFILLSYQNGFNPQYMFNQTAGFFCHVKNMDNGIKVFKLILNEFYTYLANSGTYADQLLCDLFECLDGNLRGFEEEKTQIIENNLGEEIKQIREKFKHHLEQHNITLPVPNANDSDVDDNDVDDNDVDDNNVDK